MNMVFIGAGNMAEALVAGIIEQKLHTPDELTVTDISAERLEYFAKKYGVNTSADNGAASAQADAVVLAIKPQIFPEVWPQVVSALKPDALVISIMAGVPSKIIAGEKAIRVVRVMPNTPALVGEGAAGIARGEFATEADVKTAEALMKAVGVTVIVPEEQLDAVTALSGSGPAYVFYLLESMLTAAERMGMEEEVARTLALATVKGAVELTAKTGEKCETLRRKVTSKGGTTEAAIRILEEHDVKNVVIEALLAAERRSKELAKG